MDTNIEIIKLTEELVPLLKESTDGKCCIFNAPSVLLQINPGAFTPSIVSIGPYHSKDDKRLQRVQQHKPRFVDLFLETANRNGISMTMTSLENVVGELEKDIRDSYSRHLQLSRDELVKMMVLDGCFVLMLILVRAYNVKLTTSANDIIFRLPWILPALKSDLLLIGNQVPYFLLETLFTKLRFPGYVSMKKIICAFFESMLWTMSDRVRENTEKIEPKHLLHLMREMFIPEYGPKSQGESSSDKAIHEFRVSAKYLHLQGMRFKSNRNADTILDIGLERDTLSIPLLILDPFMHMLLLNFVALEHCSRVYGDVVTSYVTFMGSLMKDQEDALFVMKEKIIQNCLGTNKEVYGFFRDVSEGVVFDLSEGYLASVFRRLKAYTSKRPKAYGTDFKRLYKIYFPNVTKEYI